MKHLRWVMIALLVFVCCSSNNMCEYLWMVDVGRFFSLLVLAFAYVTHIWPCDQIIDCAFFAARDILRDAVPLGTFKYTYCINIELLVMLQFMFTKSLAHRLSSQFYSCSCRPSCATPCKWNMPWDKELDLGVLYTCLLDLTESSKSLHLKLDCI